MSTDLVLDDHDFVSLVESFGPALKRLQRASGVSSVALLQSVAETLGQELARAMTSTSFDSVVNELRLFVSLGLGKISVEGRGPRFKLAIEGCFGCTQVHGIDDS